jgi:hypothetical protein
VVVSIYYRDIQIWESTCNIIHICILLSLTISFDIHKEFYGNHSRNFRGLAIIIEKNMYYNVL